MNVRMIGGIREVNLSDPLCGLWLEPVAFPMEVLDYDIESDCHLETTTLHTEQQLRSWAKTAFPDGYELWDLEVPKEAARGFDPTSIRSKLEELDRRITAVADDGYPTSDLTAALDALWAELLPTRRGFAPSGFAARDLHREAS